MKIKLTIFLFSLWIYLAGCSSPLKVYSTYDKKTDFSTYKTFDFFETNEEHLNMKEVNRRRLSMAIELELGKKGMRRSMNEPDLLINLYSYINRIENTVNTGNQSRVGYYGAATPYGTAIGISVSPPKSFSAYNATGVVTVHLVDRERNQLVLEGLVKVDATESDDADRMINYSVEEIFKPIPYPE